MDYCHIGFIPPYLIMHSVCYDSTLAHVIKIYSNEDESPTTSRKIDKNAGLIVAAVISMPVNSVSSVNTKSLIYMS